MTPKEIVKIIRQEQYPEHLIPMMLEDIESLPCEVKNAFTRWAETKENPVLKIEGFTFDKLVSEYQMNPLNAFITLGWLISEPEEALNILTNGYDKIK